MWLFVPGGFYSAVQHKDDPDKIMVRARAKQHAERLIKALPADQRPELVETPPPADYRWRVTVTREQWVYLAARFAAEVAYLNFKSEAGKRGHPKGFMRTLHDVWGDLLNFQDDQHADTRKHRWGHLPALHASGRSTLDRDMFAGLDAWLDRHEVAPDPADEDEYEWVDPGDVLEEAVDVALEPGMTVRLIDDEDFGDGEVVAVVNDLDMAVVRFCTPLEGGGVEEDMLEVPIHDLYVLVDPEVAEEVAEELCAGRPEPERFDDIDDLMEADDGSWPGPELDGFYRGR